MQRRLTQHVRSPAKDQPAPAVGPARRLQAQAPCGMAAAQVAAAGPCWAAATGRCGTPKPTVSAATASCRSSGPATSACEGWGDGARSAARAASSNGVPQPPTGAAFLLLPDLPHAVLALTAVQNCAPPPGSCAPAPAGRAATPAGRWSAFRATTPRRMLRRRSSGAQRSRAAVRAGCETPSCASAL